METAHGGLCPGIAGAGAYQAAGTAAGPLRTIRFGFGGTTTTGTCPISSGPAEALRDVSRRLSQARAGTLLVVA